MAPQKDGRKQTPVFQWEWNWTGNRDLLEGSGGSNLSLKRLLKTRSESGKFRITRPQNINHQWIKCFVYVCLPWPPGCPEKPAIGSSALSRGLGRNNLPRCPPASTILCSSLMKTLLIKENHCLIHCSNTLIRTQVDSYRWIWSGTFQEQWPLQKTSIGRCHSSTAFWTKAGGAGCRSARWWEKRSSIQDAHLPRERNGYVIISPRRNVTFTKGKGSIINGIALAILQQSENKRQKNRNT